MHIHLSQKEELYNNIWNNIGLLLNNINVYFSDSKGVIQGLLLGH